MIAGSRRALLHFRESFTRQPCQTSAIAVSGSAPLVVDVNTVPHPGEDVVDN